jgi:hypothetical protein
MNCPFCQTPDHTVPLPMFKDRQPESWYCETCTKHCTTLIRYNNGKLVYVEFTLHTNDPTKDGTYHFQFDFETTQTLLIYKVPYTPERQRVRAKLVDVLMIANEILPITPENAKHKLKTYLIFL